jgi:flagellar basal body P-ring formation protein FlgA
MRAMGQTDMRGRVHGLVGVALRAAVLWLIATGLCLLAGRASPGTGDAAHSLRTQADVDDAIGRILAAAFPQNPPGWEVVRRHPVEQLEGYAFELVAPATLQGGRVWFQLQGQRPPADAAATGADVKTFLLPVDLFWEDSVWVAVRPLAARHVLTAGDLERRWVRHAETPAEVDLAAPPMGLALGRAMTAGQIVEQSLLRTAPVVARGDVVRLVYRRGALTVAARAEALQGGAPGDEINVRPLDGRRTCRGRVGGPGEVEVIVP